MTRCTACNRRIKLLGKREGIGIFQCPSCGLGITGNGKVRQYEAYHRDPVYISEKSQFNNIFQKRVDIISKFKTSGRALEVGSSAGHFLSLLKERSWEVQGVEPSKTAVKEAERRGVKTMNTTFEKVKLVKNNYDLVIFNHVLEHMDDPIEVLKKASSVLKRDGLLLIDVPNFASLSARMKGVGWRYILPREHRWHFTPTSLFVLLEKTDFAPLYWEAHSGIWGYGRPFAEIWQALRDRKKRFFWDVTTAMPAWVLTKLNAGTGLTVVAQKI